MSNILTNLLKETSPSRLLRIVSTDFLALRLFCLNIRQHGRQILWFKSHVDGRRLCTVGLNQGSPNFFVRGPHKLLQNIPRAGHLT